MLKESEWIYAFVLTLVEKEEVVKACTLEPRRVMSKMKRFMAVLFVKYLF